MKMTTARYDDVALAMRRIVDAHPNLVALCKAHGFSDERIAWDIFWSTRYPIKSLYADGLNDSHISTALLRIIKGV